ncbi:phytanoyl-CoA dioxygenase family protein [Ideonella livida]|uniref:Phytanoyl-CoA dioxygenase family protein n=1 Tax=Ideonella livida TaxID=2707176 RepID=A0A7C9PKT4_9BURK|nr:phytanoyl-CoA dioxygenase family protein [Ideonella livida]NDY93951.1 phytanoyl-CoA dioxygenase family protein [Ideonella livida]
MAPSLWRTLALAPWWQASVLTSAKSFVDNPLLGSAWLNERGLHAWRVRATQALAARRRARLAALVSPQDRADFERDGFVVRHEALPREVFARLREAVLNRPMPAREMVQGDTITRRMAVDAGLRAASPELAQFVDGPLWQGLTRYVAGYDAPPWAYIQTILSHTRPGEPDPQTNLHADTFHPSMKAWLFLTDVAVDEGPFCYVPGSHRLTPERLAWEQRKSVAAARLQDRYSARGSFRIDAAELPALNLPAPRLLAVPANTLVVADTYGFHARGPSVRPSTRVELWGYDRRNPFLPGSTDLPLQWLGLMDERPRLYWEQLDRLERLGWGRNPWRSAGTCRPADRR